MNSAEPNKCIIFIHGAGGNSNLWKLQVQELCDFYKIILVDLPGHVNSKTKSELSMELYLNALNLLISNINSRQFFLTGHSMGGAICMAYNLKYNNLNGLILIGTGAKLKVNPLIFEVLNKDFKTALDHLDSISLYSKSKEYKEFLREEALKVPAETFINDFKICNSFNIMDQLDKINIPTLIICGEKDLLTPVKYSNYLHEKIKNSQIHIIPKAGHCVYFEKSKIVNELIKKFIKSI
ncbi:MAG: alpha/beta fold hydrolase [Candidatus Helarchaeota archaeon]